jgi:hypothetical protein
MPLAMSKTPVPVNPTADLFIAAEEPVLSEAEGISVFSTAARQPSDLEERRTKESWSRVTSSNACNRTRH